MSLRGNKGALVGTTANPLEVRNRLPNPTQGQGSVAVPAAAAVIADTGVLAAGTYRIEYSVGFSDVAAAGKGLTVEHRNAANSGNIAVLDHLPAPGRASGCIERVVIATNERVRIINAGIVGGAGSLAVASIRAYMLPA